MDTKRPFSVYKPVRYILSAGGKRVRAVLVLIACEAVGGRTVKALDAAVAIEILHNFTLVHDDVMDNAELRRGLPTIHEKWDEDIAILAGDELAALAYRSLLKTKTPCLQRVAEIFTDTFIEVCEGQGFDKEFETQRDVSLKDYIVMIQKKTASMIAAAAEIGAMVGGGTKHEVNALRRFGHYLGIAFQIQDDLLDIIGSEKEFGKTIGGDIMEGKKTYLLLKAFELATRKDKVLLQSVMQKKRVTKATVERVREVYEREGVIDAAREEITRCTRRAQQYLKQLKPSKAREMLFWLSHQLLNRTS